MITARKLMLLTLFIISGFVLSAQKPEVVTIDGKIYEKVEIEASYPGGVEAWRNFLIKNLKATTPVDNGAPAGVYTVIVQFVVDKEGNISDIKALTNHGYGMEQEVVRIMKFSEKWTPAIQNGKPVKAYRKQPVTFQVMNEDMEITTETPHTLFTKIDNPITIKVDKLKPQDFYVTISSGSMTNMGNGRYIVRVAKPGKTVIRVFQSKKNKELGAESFEVREK
ncbi:MAG TPA: GldM family protein [Chitinophagaceae bacterium]|nr:GldM family protein [Chitinophagaceae bacterium]